MYSAVMVEPVFGITPETLNAVNMIPSFRSAILFFDNHMVAAQAQRSVSVPVVGIVETSRFGMLLNERNKGFGLTRRNWHDSYFSVALHHSEYENLASGAPAAFSLLFASKYSFVALNNAFQNRFALFNQT